MWGELPDRTEKGKDNDGLAGNQANALEKGGGESQTIGLIKRRFS